MGDVVKLVECPRDAWQGLPTPIPARQKADYLRKLIAAGFTHIDAVSFVSPTAVPQMADSEEAMRLLGPSGNIELIGIVVNERGAQRAIETGRVQTLGFPYSISPEFLRRNQRQSQQESLQALRSIVQTALTSGLNVVAYISMAFGNPYGDPWSIDAIVNACGVLMESGVKQISLADTVGLASPSQVSEVVAAALRSQQGTEVGVHLHARAEDAAAKVRAAYGAGCRRFDSAIGGLGGCPFAQDALVGNIATETLLDELRELDAQLPVLQPLDDLMRSSDEIARNFSAAHDGPCMIKMGLEG